MKTKSILTLLFSLILLTNVSAQDKYTKLQQKIDSLETKLEIVNSKLAGSNPHFKGDAVNWGNGFFSSAKMGTHYSMNLEFGYMWKIKKNPLAAFSRDYIGIRKDYRFGLSAGMQMFSHEPVNKNDVTFYRSTSYGPYFKFNFGTPVLFNLISFSWHIKAMYAIPTCDNDHKIRDNRMVYGYGNDIEFWLWENECVSLGFTDETDSAFGHKNDPIVPSKIRLVVGYKTFF